MNILQINTLDTLGGAAKICNALKVALEKNDGKTSMFVKIKYGTDPNVKLARWPNYASRLSKKMTGKDVGSYIGNKIRPLLANDIDFFSTDKILRTPEFREADIVHCHNLHGNYFKLETLLKISERKPVIWTIHDVWPITAHCARIYGDEKPRDGFYGCRSLDEYQNLLWDNTEYLTKRKKEIYTKLKNIHLVAPSLWLKEKIAQSVLRDKPLSLIYNGVDTDIFKPTDREMARKLLNLPKDKKIILLMATREFDSGKGGEHIERILKEYENDDSILFLSLGTTRWPVPETSQNIKSVGYIEDEKTVALYFSAADVFLFPSLAETFGLAAAEASACGIPSVVFKAGGLPEIVQHMVNGYVAEYDNHEDLAKGVKLMLTLSPEKKKEMSEYGRARAVKLFTVESMIDNYFNLYKKLLFADGRPT